LSEELATELICSVVLEWGKPDAGVLGLRWQRWAGVLHAIDERVWAHDWAVQSMEELCLLADVHHRVGTVVDVFFGRAGVGRIRELEDAGGAALIRNTWPTPLLDEEIPRKLRFFFFLNTMLLHGHQLRGADDDPLHLACFVDAAYLPVRLEIERRARGHVGYLAAQTILLLRARKVGGGSIGEQFLSDCVRHLGRLALATRPPVPRWALDEIREERGHQDLDDRPSLLDEVDQAVVETLGRPAWMNLQGHGVEGIMRKVLAGRLDIAPRSVRDAVVKTARRARRIKKREILDLEFVDRESARLAQGRGRPLHDERPGLLVLPADPESELVAGVDGRALRARLSNDPRYQKLCAALAAGAETQTEIAKHLGVTDRTVRNWIHGLRREHPLLPGERSPD
jgi:hypothetical protein